MAFKKEKKIAEVKQPALKSKAFEEALAKLEGLPHLNYTEAKDIIVAVFRTL